MTQGTEADFAGGKTLDLSQIDLTKLNQGDPTRHLTLDGPYLISIRANGYEVGGAHFTLPLTGPVTVNLGGAAPTTPSRASSAREARFV